MTELLFINQVCVLLLVITLAYAATTDMRFYKITNPTSLTALLLFVPFVLTSETQIHVLHAIIAAVVVFAVGFVLFMANALGGGDVKLLTSVALWAGADHVFTMLVIVSVLGGLLSLGIAGYHYGMFYMQKAMQPTLRSIKIPYGVAISFGGFFVALQYLQPTLSHLSF